MNSSEYSGASSALAVDACSAAALDPQEMFLECLRAGYVLLMRGDVMRAGDEVLRLHDRQWMPLPSGWDVGHPWDSKHWPPARRKRQNNKLSNAGQPSPAQPSDSSPGVAL